MTPLRLRVGSSISQFSAAPTDVNALEILLLEPDLKAARAVLDSVSRAFTGVRAVHVESIEGLKATSLRGVTVALCADQPPDCDAMGAIDIILQRRESLPISLPLRMNMICTIASLFSRAIAITS